MTTIKIESDEESVSRVIHAEEGDEAETWPELVSTFFQMLKGMGYYFESSPEDFVAACNKLEDK